MSFQHQLYHTALPRFAIAPMMDWTDRYCRSFHRALTRKALLYTEMINAEAVLHGDRAHLLRFCQSQHPLALQLGGARPAKLAEAARIAADYGYDEINLNVGCPSSRVQSGTFGACLMRRPKLVAQCITAMKKATNIPITIKCRLGVDEQDPETALDALIKPCLEAGVEGIWVHARKAWLKGLSPKENRNVPPLDYGRVYRLKQQFPSLFVGINGGITSLAQGQSHLQHVDGVMLGRAAYRQSEILLQADSLFYGEKSRRHTPEEALISLFPRIEKHLQNGGRLHAFTRHFLGLFQGRPGARRFRQILSTKACLPGANLNVLEEALDALSGHAVAHQAADKRQLLQMS